LCECPTKVGDIVATATLDRIRRSGEETDGGIERSPEYCTVLFSQNKFVVQTSEQYFSFRINLPYKSTQNLPNKSALQIDDVFAIPLVHTIEYARISIDW
jgi:hypothetical protein